MIGRTVQVVVDPETCFGSGICSRIGAEIFSSDIDAVVVLLHADGDGTVTVSGPQIATVEQAALACPAGAITVVG